MITVHEHGTNSIKLAGNCLAAEGGRMSSIFLAPTGWVVAVLFDRNSERLLAMRQDVRLPRVDVLPTLRRLLDLSGFQDEEINSPEINRYLDLIQQDFGPGGKYGHDRGRAGKQPSGEPLRVNLWECLTHRIGCKDSHADEREEVVRITAALGHAARYNGQEISVEAKPDGWEIKLFSCYDYARSEGEEHVPARAVVIFVPKDNKVALTMHEENNG